MRRNANVVIPAPKVHPGRCTIVVQPIRGWNPGNHVLIFWTPGYAGVTAIVVALALSGAATAAQPAYPTKPIRMIVAVPPGGPADTLARLVAPKLTESLGQAVVIDNRAGANGIIAYETTARATPDGYTFTAVASGVVINPRIQKARSIAVWILAYAGMTYKPISSVRRDDVQTM